MEADLMEDRIIKAKDDPSSCLPPTGQAPTMLCSAASHQMGCSMHCHRLYTGLLLLATLLVIPGQGTAQDARECVDINTASAAQLDRIIHIGPARAEQIIQLRAQRRFANVDELVRVRGIAAARLQDIKAQGLACVRAVIWDERPAHTLWMRSILSGVEVVGTGCAYSTPGQRSPSSLLT